MHDQTIAVLFHGDCPDGLGGAYAAWKKFGDTAAYVPLFDRITPPEGLAGREVYLIDFSFPEAALRALEGAAARLVVLDHHISAREAVEEVREHVFDNERSGAHIAWRYFHPTLPLPLALAYIEDNDLWRRALPHTDEFAAYYSVHRPGSFEEMDALVCSFERPEYRDEVLRAGGYYREHFESLCDGVVKRAQPVVFEGHTVYAVNASREFGSQVGHMLAKLHPPFGIVWCLYEGVWHVSLRGDGSIDCSELAGRYGGGGHRDSAAFRIPYGTALPFTFCA